MNTRFPRRQEPIKTFTSRKEGFALIITISLMAFLVLLLVSLTTMTRVETQLASNNQHIQNAQQNARMALNVAVAQLQRFAGPDFAITARADINTIYDNNPYWTGVWDDDGTGFGVQTWLVSGNEDPTLGPGIFPFEPDDDHDAEDNLYYVSPAADMVRLVDVATGYPDGTPPNEKVLGAVVAPRIPLIAKNYPGQPGDTTVGHYAYWVGDQGVKASMAKTVRNLDTYPPTEPDRLDKQQILRQLMPQRFGHHPIFQNVATIEGDPKYTDRLRQVHSLHQMSVAADRQYDDFSSPVRDALRMHFHDITHFNMGVMASTAGTGLKEDLSYHLRAGSGPTAFRSFMDAEPSNLPISTSIEYDMVPPTPAGGAGASFKVAPVLSEVLVNYTVETMGRAVMVSIDASLEIWNPYNATLNGEQLLLMMENLPNIEVYFPPDSTDPIILDLEATLVDAIDDLLFSSGNMLPGSIREIIIPTVGPLPALDDSGNPIILPPPSVGPPPQPDEWRLETTFPGVTIDLRLGALPTDPLISTYNSDVFRDLVTEDLPTSEPHEFGFYLRMRDGNDDENWLTYYNPAATELDDEDDSDPDSVKDPFETQMDVTAAPGMSLNGFPGEWLTPANTITLFDLPRQDVVSLGSLQHLYVQNTPTYAIGNPWGGPPVNVNDLFDQYFISTIPPTWTAVSANDFPLPHTGFIPFHGQASGLDPYTDLLADQYSTGENLLLQGMFNINSTSVHAWRSVLSALNIVDTPPTANTNWIFNGGNVALRNAFFRYSHTGDMLSTYTNDPSALSNMSNAFRQGVRELLDTEITLLAEGIVDELRLRGQPFPSLAEFVNSGIIQDSIDAVTTINDGIPLYSPAYLSQADIITALAPFMMARSDTFLVRAYGDSMNPATGAIEGRAMCEAIVQRVPTPFDPSGDIVDPSLDATPFGRKFEIIYFRWLDSSEL